MNRVHQCFSIESDNYLYNIFNNEIKRLIPILNKKFNTNVKYSDLEVRFSIYSDNDAGNLEYPLSYFGINNKGKYVVAIIPNHDIKVFNNPNSRPHKIYKSLELFIKDCACHELFHVYDFYLNKSKGSPCNHEGWWLDNYKEFRKSYTNHDLIVEHKYDKISNEYYDLAYFSNIKSLMFYKCSYSTLRDGPFQREFKDKKKLAIRLIGGEYLDYINSHSNTKNIDLVVAKTVNSIYEIRSISSLHKPCLVLSIDVIYKFIDTLNIDYLDALIYAINFLKPYSNIDEAIKDYKLNKWRNNHE